MAEQRSQTMVDLRGSCCFLMCLHALPWLAKTNSCTLRITNVLHMSWRVNAIKGDNKGGEKRDYVPKNIRKHRLRLSCATQDKHHDYYNKRRNHKIWCIVCILRLQTDCLAWRAAAWMKGNCLFVCLLDLAACCAFNIISMICTNLKPQPFSREQICAD